MTGKSRSARMRNARLLALKQQEGRCFYCKSPLMEAEATADHKMPRDHGGTDAQANIVAACAGCNYAKADLPDDHFFKLITANVPPKRGGAPMMLVWATRRIWRKVHKACARIERLAA